MSILKLLSNQGFISYNKIIARTCGVNEAILIGELCSIQDFYRTEEFYIVQERISNDTALSIKQIRTTLLNLEEEGIISISRKGIPCRNYYKINAELLNEIIKNGENQPAENIDLIAQTEEQDVTKGNNLELQKETTREEKRLVLLNNKNTEVRIQNKNTQEACVSYLQEPKFNTSKDYQSFIKDSFSLIAEHNKNAKKKIPISKDILFFSQKEGRDLIELSKQYEPEEILKALKNYLKVANSDTWKSGFSFRAFCKNISEYTTDFFDISKYIEVKESDEDIQIITQKFADEWMKEKWFDYAVFHRHRKEWLEAGKPEKEEFVKWADKVYAEDNKKGLIY